MVEPYMTKEYYMPGYVDTAPKKDYPPHIRHFKDYIGSIGEFQKHGYEEQDYGPDSDSFKPDTDGFGPNTDGFGGYGAGDNSFRPSTEGFGNVQRNFRPAEGGYRSDFENAEYRPSTGGFGTASDYRPSSGGFGTASDYKPQGSDYRGEFS